MNDIEIDEYGKKNRKMANTKKKEWKKLIIMK